jgi:hypothetical protein
MGFPVLRGGFPHIVYYVQSCLEQNMHFLAMLRVRTRGKMDVTGAYRYKTNVERQSTVAEICLRPGVASLQCPLPSSKWSKDLLCTDVTPVRSE